MVGGPLNDLVKVGGALTLDGTINVSLTADGYRLDGDGVRLDAGEAVVRVGDGTSASAPAFRAMSQRRWAEAPSQAASTSTTSLSSRAVIVKASTSAMAAPSRARTVTPSTRTDPAAGTR